MQMRFNQIRNFNAQLNQNKKMFSQQHRDDDCQI